MHVNWFSLLKKDISTEKKHFIRHYSVPTYIENIKKTINQMLMQSAEAIFSPEQ